MRLDLDPIVKSNEFSTDKAVEYFQGPLLEHIHKIEADEERPNSDGSSGTTVTPEFNSEWKATTLKKMGCKSICHSTALRWLHWLGYEYKPLIRTYYCDRHEAEEQLEKRRVWVDWWAINERRMLIWMILSKTELDTLARSKDIKGMPKARHTFPKDGETYHEYCMLDDVDLFERIFHKLGRKQTGVSMGEVSVRILPHETPLITVGQDEAIFNQHTYSNRHWHTPDKTSKLLPKSLGQGIMISAYTGFVTGFGGATLPELTPEVLARINSYRQGEHHSKYIDEESAVEVTGKSEKELFTSAQQVRDVFLTKFEYGKDKEGYWNNARASVQTMDVVDCLMGCYPGFDFALLYDQPSGTTSVKPRYMRSHPPYFSTKTMARA